MLTREKFPSAPLSRVVLLGSSGFIGRSLGRRLADLGIEVLAVNSSVIDLSQQAAASRLADMLRPRDAVVMLSALAHRGRSDSESLLKNLAMGETVCHALARKPCAHVVYVSSDSVYPFGNDPITERSPTSPTYLYAAMHTTREIMFRETVKTRLAILRPTQIYGADDSHNAYGPMRMMRSAIENKRIDLFGDGEETRDHLLIDDLVALLTHVLEQRAAGLLNLASGVSTSFAQIATLISAQFDGAIALRTVPRQLAGITHRRFDISELRNFLPSFVATPLDQGLALMQAQLQAQPPAAQVSAS